MQIFDLIKPMGDMSDEELMERLRQVRHNRTTERPAAKSRAKKAAKKGATSRINKVDDLFSQLTPEQKAELIAQLGGGK